MAEDDSEGVRNAIRAMSDEYSETAISKETLAILGQFTQAACEHVNIRMDKGMFFASVEGWVWFWGEEMNEDPSIIPLDSKNNRPWTTDSALEARYFGVGGTGEMKVEKQRFAGAWKAFICVPDLDNPNPKPIPVQIDFCPKCGKRLPGLVRRYNPDKESPISKLMKVLGWK